MNFEMVVTQRDTDLVYLQYLLYYLNWTNNSLVIDYFLIINYIYLSLSKIIKPKQLSMARVSYACYYQIISTPIGYVKENISEFNARY